MPPAARQWPIRAGSELNELKHSTCVIVLGPEPLSSVIFYLEYFVELNSDAVDGKRLCYFMDH